MIDEEKFIVAKTLIKLIADLLATGASEQHIREALAKAGIPQSICDQALRDLNG